MEKRLIFILALFFCCKAFSQTQEKILDKADSTLGFYLSRSLCKMKIDSCVSGIYFVKFSLERNGVVINYACSRQMPKEYKIAIKNILDSLKGSWNKKFLKLVTLNKRIILQAVNIDAMNDCKVDVTNNWGFNQLNDSLSNDDSRYYTTMAALTLSSKNFLSMQSTFDKSFDFDSSNSSYTYMDAIILKPCVVIQKIPRERKYIQ